MPILLTPEQGQSGGSPQRYELSNVGEYAYPMNLDFKPGSKLHEKVKTEVLNRARAAKSVMEKRHPSWNAIDDMLNVYIEPTVYEKALKEKLPNKPISIVVPYSFATLETILTYLTMAFFQDPMFQYDGRGPEDLVGAKLLELTIDQQIKRSQGALAIHTMFRDGIAYGIGPVAVGWKKEYGNRVIAQQPNFMSKMGQALGMSMGRKKITVPSIFYEGTELQNLDPYQILPDVNVPIHLAGDGEFFGWVEESPLTRLLTMESWPDTDLFNVRYLKLQQEPTCEFTLDPSRRGYAMGMNERRQMYGVTNARTLVHMYVDLIPREWGLTTSEYPEKWFFSIADGATVIRAKPMNLVHNKFPIVIAAPDYDGYSAAPVSRLEMAYGLQHVLNFLFNSHVANVRRAVNNMFVVDPSLINMGDFNNPEDGLLIRLKRAAWGRGVTDSVQQLAVNDVTKNNISEAFEIMGITQRVTAATENMMGLMREGSERRSATEARGTLVNAMNRLERIAKLISVQTFQPLSYMMAFHTQQMMSQETYVKIVGDWVKELSDELGPQFQSGSRRKVSPFDILVEFDIIPRDGSLPMDVVGITDSWIQIFQIIAQQPILMQGFDIVRIFKHMARLMGAKNISAFTKPDGGAQMNLSTDEAVQAEVQKGNLVPFAQKGKPGPEESV